MNTTPEPTTATPRSDEQIWFYPEGAKEHGVVPTILARTLERELHAANQRIAELEAEKKKGDAELESILQHIPNAIRVREGGAFENLYASVAVSVQSLRQSLADSEVTYAEQLANAKADAEAAWINRDHLCHHINIIGKEVLGPRINAFKGVCCAPEAVSCEARNLVERLEAERDSLRKHLQKAEPALREVMQWHRDPDSPNYNGCEKPGEQCMWCDGAEQALTPGKEPPPTVSRQVADGLADALERNKRWNCWTPTSDERVAAEIDYHLADEALAAYRSATQPASTTEVRA
jgi:hypothetical protein